MGTEEHKPSYEELLEENRLLRAQVEMLTESLEEAQKRIEELERAGKRQAAPFRRRESQKKPGEKKNSPGRKPGHKPSWRPKPDHVDEQRMVPLKECPHCGGPVSEVRPIEQFIEEVPPVRAKVIRLITHSGWCSRCNRRVRSTDPEQVSTATGAAGVHVGRYAAAFMAYCKYVLGLSYRSIAGLMKVFGLEIRPGGIVGVLYRAAARSVANWLEIWKEIRAGPVACCDETSWYVGEPGWWLWVFCRPGWTLYAVEESRGSQVVQRTLEGFEGVLVSDCLSSYDPPDMKKQKCYSHHLKALSESIEKVPPESKAALEELRRMLRAAMALGRVGEDISPEGFLRHRERLEAWADRILDATYSAPGVEKALGRFRKHREHLFTFLYEPEVPPTNNLAERQLRPAVIARKISCGNRTKWGRLNWQILASVAATCRQRGVSFLHQVAQAMPLQGSPPELKAA